MKITVAGAGAFGTALAIALAQGDKDITLWARSSAAAKAMIRARENAARLPNITLPDNLMVTSSQDALRDAECILLAIPAQKLGAFIDANHSDLAGKALVACAKGIDLNSLQGTCSLVAEKCPSAIKAILTGPSFAADIARGLPTALTLACQDDEAGRVLQDALSTQSLRLYRSTDTLGAELGGALKNVIAIACGVCIGAGLGESARAALITRGYAEMQRLAQRLGAQPETLSGLSGFGDLALTCTSTLSRNYRHGVSIGSGEGGVLNETVEGAASAKAVSALAKKLSLDLPISQVTAALVEGKMDAAQAMDALLSRPLKQE